MTSAATSDMINTSKGADSSKEREMIEMKKITLVGWNQEQALIDGLNSVFEGRYTFDQVSGDHCVVVDGESFADLRLWDENDGREILTAWFNLHFAA